MNTSTYNDYWKWMHRETATPWVETSTHEMFIGTTQHIPKTNTNGWKNTFYNTLYRLQHVYKQMQEVLTGEFLFGIIRLPIWTSVPLNEDTKLKQFGLCIVCVPIQPSLQWFEHEQILNWTRTSSPNSACTNLLRWTDEMKVTKSTRAFKQLCNGKRPIY